MSYSIASTVSHDDSATLSSADPSYASYASTLHSKGKQWFGARWTDAFCDSVEDRFGCGGENDAYHNYDGFDFEDDDTLATDNQSHLTKETKESSLFPAEALPSSLPPSTPKKPELDDKTIEENLQSYSFFAKCGLFNRCEEEPVPFNGGIVAPMESKSMSFLEDTEAEHLYEIPQDTFETEEESLRDEQQQQQQQQPQQQQQATANFDANIQKIKRLAAHKAEAKKVPVPVPALTEAQQLALHKQRASETIQKANQNAKIEQQTKPLTKLEQSKQSYSFFAKYHQSKTEPAKEDQLEKVRQQEKAVLNEFVQGNHRGWGVGTTSPMRTRSVEAAAQQIWSPTDTFDETLDGSAVKKTSVNGDDSTTWAESSSYDDDTYTTGTGTYYEEESVEVQPQRPRSPPQIVRQQQQLRQQRQPPPQQQQQPQQQRPQPSKPKPKPRAIKIVTKTPSDDEEKPFDEVGSSGQKSAKPFDESTYASSKADSRNDSKPHPSELRGNSISPGQHNLRQSPSFGSRILANASAYGRSSGSGSSHRQRSFETSSEPSVSSHSYGSTFSARPSYVTPKQVLHHTTKDSYTSFQKKGSATIGIEVLPTRNQEEAKSKKMQLGRSRAMARVTRAQNKPKAFPYLINHTLFHQNLDKKRARAMGATNNHRATVGSGRLGEF